MCGAEKKIKKFREELIGRVEQFDKLSMKEYLSAEYQYDMKIAANVTQDIIKRLDEIMSDMET
jgi:hypothetical protein